MDDGKEMIKVLYEDNHLLGIEKPVNVPVQEDSSKDKDLLTMGKEYLKEKYQKPGNVYLGLVHRLDRPVGGAMIFAKTSKAASRLSDSIRTNKMHKIYYAVVEGNTKDHDKLVDYLYKDERTNMVRVVNEKQGKYCALEYETLERRNGLSLVKIHLETGRSHQIRVQFSSRNMPLVGDMRYNRSGKKCQIALWATKLSFPHPTTKEIITLHSMPPKNWPWNEFEVML